ncbi:MAG: response regulator [Chthoniobacteraceae bacterium]
MNNDSEHQLSEKLHDLRTPLNQIMGFSEMLIEVAEEDGHNELLNGLGMVRDAAVELTSLLQDKKFIVTTPQPDREYWPLGDVVRDAINRVLGFVDPILEGSVGDRFGTCRDDLSKIRSAARHFLDTAVSSGLLIRLETTRHWDNSPAAFRKKPSQGPADVHGKVLIVDDENLNREILCRRLQREGYQANGAASGREALDILRKEPFDAILLDILMPEMSGIEVLQALKQDAHLRHLPVIMLSAITDIDRVVRCIELGAEDFLPKPTNSVLLRARLGACLEKKQLRDQEQAHFQALHAEKERLSVTLRSLADAVVTTDAAGRVVLLNDVAASLTGVSREGATGLPLEEVFRIYDRATGRPAANVAAEVLARNAVVESDPGIAIMPPDGIERLVSLRCAPIYNHEGVIHGTVVVVRDITEKEKMAEELLRASKLQSIGVLAGGLAHDFNNMLTAVQGNLSLLREMPGMQPDALLSIQEAERGALRVQELTQYLLTFSEGGAPIKQLFQAGKLIQETSAFVVRGSNVNCEFHLASDLWETEADPNQIAQVISNIVLNAVEATPNGGKIEVSAKNVTAPPANLLPGDYLCVTVQDRGIGISPEHLPRIYDPFFTTKKQARGLGLAAAYSIIQRHGGHIAVESGEGMGTTVTFHLYAVRSVAPVIESAPDRGQEPPVANVVSEAPPKRGNLRVLVMDDDESIRILTGVMFKQLGYDVVSVPDGDSALLAHADAVAAGRPFDLVVMDLTIPGGMGGKEAIRRLREKDTTVRAIVSSGYSHDPVMAHYAEHGFDGVLPKPYARKGLIDTLKQLHLA